MPDYTSMDSPVGPLLLASDQDGLRLIEFEPARYPEPKNESWVKRLNPILEQTIAELSEYFQGKRREFDIPLAPHGSAFQRKVWNALLGIPYGTVCSYSDVARRIGEPTASRAVGHANGRNPIPIIVPCHRVVGANGSLTGYGGGLHVKKFLLDLELGSDSNCAETPSPSPMQRRSQLSLRI